jgi:hypothetical protein
MAAQAVTEFSYTANAALNWTLTSWQASSLRISPHAALTWAPIRIQVRCTSRELPQATPKFAETFRVVFRRYRWKRIDQEP